MGGIDSWKAPISKADTAEPDKIEQGNAGFLTQKELDEMAAEGTEINEPAEVAPLAPERRAEVVEAIKYEEARLDTNVGRTQELTSTLDAKLDDPVGQEAATPSKELLTLATINYARSRASERINELGVQYGSVAILGTMVTGMGVGEYGLYLDSILKNGKTMTEAGVHVMEGGVAVAGVVVAAWVLSKALSWLDFRSKEKKLRNGEEVHA
jgi:hypothetical protein